MCHELAPVTQCTRPAGTCRGGFALPQEDGSVAIRLMHHKTENSAGAREWVIQARPSGGTPSRAWLPRTICPVQAATVAAKAWTCLLDQAAPLLRAAGSQQDLLFLSGQGEPLVRSRVAAIAALQLTAAGLPGLTARSVGTPPWVQRMGSIGGAHLNLTLFGRFAARASSWPEKATWGRRARLLMLKSW